MGRSCVVYGPPNVVLRPQPCRPSAFLPSWLKFAIELICSKLFHTVPNSALQYAPGAAVLTAAYPPHLLHPLLLPPAL